MSNEDLNFKHSTFLSDNEHHLLHIASRLLVQQLTFYQILLSIPHGHKLV